MAERIQLSRRRGWRKPEGAVVVARPSRWGNPFRVGERRFRFNELGWGVVTGRDLGPVLDGETATVVELSSREDAVAMYEAWLASVQRSARPLDLSLLAGRDLACWCPLDEPCHADVLLKLASQGADT